MTTSRLSVDTLDDGAIQRVSLGGSKGNVLDTPLIEELTGVFNAAAAARDLKAIVLEGQGAHFSFGASVREHLPELVGTMLPRFHVLMRALVDSATIVLAAVRGQCLGGGLELVTLCHRVFAAPQAMFGQPEIVLGVFAPVASVALAGRVGRRDAEDLCLSGRSVSAAEAAAMGLVDEVADGDPAEAALAYARQHLLPKSASSLRFAIRAVRADLRARLATELPVLEQLYLEELMATTDATEGLTAFMEKRRPNWTNT
ncbi:MAG: enoyl-CoA hydratase-related protein [Acidobacteriota bacterium]